MDASKVEIAPHGFVHLKCVTGSDQMIAECATVGRESKDWRKLIRYMVRHKHTSPFEFASMIFHVKLPIFVARQWMRHRACVFNELSARHGVMPDQVWLPTGDLWRGQSADNRQGSSAEFSDHEQLLWGSLFDSERHGPFTAEEAAFAEYRERIKNGVAREQARSCVPVSTYTEFYWNINLHNLFHFLHLRSDKHAQAEIREYADAIDGMVEQAFPVAHGAWVDCVRDAMTLTLQDQRAFAAMLKSGSPNVGKHFPNDRECREFVEKMELLAWT